MTYQKKETISSNFIFACIISIFLFFESIIILLTSIKKGFMKKQILSEETNLGFDIIIKNK